MKILHFALGICFDVAEGDDVSPMQLWEEIFSVLTVSDVGGMRVYGGMIPSATYENEEPCYICAFNDGGLKAMRNIFKKVDADAGVGMYLSAVHPFLQSNALEHIDGLTYYGKVQRDGSITGGDAPFFDIRVCKEHGRRRPVGKGITFMLAPEAIGGALTSRQVIRRMTIAARRHFVGVRILPLPLTDQDGNGMVDAVLTACSGTGRSIKVQDGAGGELDGRYAVLRGSTAVIEAPSSLSSYAIGELMRRALDERLHTIFIGGADSAFMDHGFGCLRALGAKLLDEKGEETSGSGGVCGIDVELLHPRITETEIIFVKKDAADPARPVRLVRRGEGEEHVYTLTDAGRTAGGAAVMEELLHAARSDALSALLSAVQFGRIVKGISLVVTCFGGNAHYASCAYRIAEQCADNGVSAVLVAAGENEKKMAHGGSPMVLHAPIAPGLGREQASERLDEIADRMFGLIRLGRVIETNASHA